MSVGPVFGSSPVNYRITTTYNPLSEEGMERIQRDSFLPIYQIRKESFFLEEEKEPFLLEKEVVIEHSCLLTPLPYCGSTQERTEIIFQSVIGRYKVPLKIAPNYRKDTDAFGTYIRKLLFSENYSDDQSEDYSGDPMEIKALVSLIENMKVVAQKEGFEVILTHNISFPRDSLILTAQGKHVLCASEEDIVENAVELALSKAFIHQEGARNQTTQVFFKGWFGQGRYEAEGARKDYKNHYPTLEPVLPFYIEGGNQYILDNLKDERQLLMGEESFWVSFNYLYLSGYFVGQDFTNFLNKMSKAIGKSLTQEKIQKTLLEMYSQARIQGNGEIDALMASEEVQEDPRSKEHWLKIAEEKGWYKPLELSDQQIIDLRPTIIEYLIQKEVALRLIAHSFGVKVKNIHLIPQPSYHIDLHLRPGPHGSFFVQSYAFCCDILQTIQIFAKELELTTTDIIILQNYLRCMKTLRADLEPLMEQIVAKIRAAGFSTIPAPAAFYNNVVDESVNFMNAITGCSEKTGAYFYIVLGAQLGDRLGKILMEVYAQFLNSYQTGIHVHYVGYDPKHSEDFWPTRLFCKKDNDFGVHCMSTEYETENNLYTNRQIIYPGPLS